MANETNYNIFKDFLESINYSTPTDLDTFKEGKKIIYQCNNGHQSSANVDTFRSKKKKCMEQEGSVLCVKCVGKKVGRPKGSTDASLDSAYNTYKRFLESVGYKITIDFEQFNQSSTKDTSRRVTFVCNEGHETEVSSAVFNRKKREYEKNGTMLCNDCTGRGKSKDVDTKLEELRKVVFEMNGHHVMAINGTVTHKCGLCGEVNESWESNIRSKTTLHCRKCKDTDVALEASCSRPVKKPEFGMGVFMNFEKYLEERGYEMVSNFEEFQKNEMSFKCELGHVTPMKVTSFNNRKHSTIIKDNSKLLCHDCNCKGETFEDKLVNLMCEVKLNTGHEVLTLERNRVVTFKCGVCGNINTSSSHNLTRRNASSRCNICVENPMHNPESVHKLMMTSFSKKAFKYPSGRVDMVMGYEPLCIATLLNSYEEDDIVTDCRKIPTFKYRCVNDNGTERDAVYYPDILLPDKIIEVKSTWTFEKEKINNLRKFEAVANAGYKFECWIYDGRKNTNPNILTF